LRRSSERLRVVSFKAEDELVEAADAAARAMNTTRSEVIRRALEQYLADLGYYPPPRGEAAPVVKIRVL